MGGLLSELGKKLAERWLTLLVLPGALYLAVTAMAVTLGHAHALDVGILTKKITGYAKAPAVTTTGGQVVLLAAVLAGAAMVGVIAQTLGSAIERLVMAAGWRSWRRPMSCLAHCWVSSRQTRWDTQEATWHEEYQKARAPDPADRPGSAKRHRAARARDRIAVKRPDRPTWSGDRIHAAALRLERDYYLDLATVWPHLWFVLPEPARNDLTAARTTLSRATTLASWAALYAVLVIWWWPAAPLTVVLGASARHRIRTATDTYAQLMESAARLHATDLAKQLGIQPANILDQELGHTLTHRLRTHHRTP